MALLDLTTHYVALGALLATAIAFTLFQPTGLVKWLQKKNYQYEVTFSLYMLTPTEKFVFNSVLFLTCSMLTTACVLYLPDHVSTISKRVYYYFAGESGSASRASEAMLGAATDIAEAAYSAAGNTAAVAQEAVSQAAEGLGWT